MRYNNQIPIAKKNENAPLWRIEADKLKDPTTHHDPLTDHYKIFEVANKRKEREEGK